MRHPTRIAALTVALIFSGCTTYRIVRWQTPTPSIRAAFPERVIPRAPEPFLFGKAAPREGLESLCVRDADAVFRPLREYLDRRKVLAFLVIRDDKILYEHYARGYTADTVSTVFSVSKSILSSLVGLALDKGAIHSLDDPITRYIPELASNANFDGVTVRHLLTMQSGFRYSKTNGHLLHDFFSDDAGFQYTTDLRARLKRLQRQDAPGTRWAYKDSDTELLAWVLERATGERIADQFARQIWSRIGTEHDATWSLDRRGGVERAASGFNTSARDLAKYGRLYLNHGDWNGQQVLPRAWVDTSVTLDETKSEPDVKTWWRMQHHFLWWIPMLDWQKERDFYADGHAGQRLYVNPPARTIIVQIAADSRQEFPFRRITRFIDGKTYPLAVDGRCSAEKPAPRP